jgi:hypothetical protein
VLNDGRVQATNPNANQNPGYGGGPVYNQGPVYGQGPVYNSGPQQPYGGQYSAPQPMPAQLTITPGTYVTVRVNQQLSSDRNQPGDAFTATLTDPVVVNGVVVAEPGQTLGGQVTEAVKAGRIEGTARLGVVLTDLTLADGQKLPIRTQFLNRKAGTSVGRDAGAIAGTTALGAAIGGAVGWGEGAAIGAGVGAAASTIGVLLTRGHASVIYPEQVLTFRVEAPVSFTTTNAPQAFHYVQPGEYDRQPSFATAGPGPQMNASAPPPAYYAAPYPYPAPYYGYPYYGPSVSFWYGGPRYYGRGFYYGRPVPPHVYYHRR